MAWFLALRFELWPPGQVLLWPLWLLLAALPCFNMGTPDQPLCEGTPIHLAAAAVGLALTVVFYAAVALVLLTRAETRSKASLPADA